MKKSLIEIEAKIFFSTSECTLLPLWKTENSKIAFTNGCFDIIHRGHIEYLVEAGQLAEHLVIGLNSDASVKRLKGANRPINDQFSRALVLAALDCVDAVFFFEEDTPYQLIERIQPDILVKGADYQIEKIVGYDIVTAKGGKVITIPFVEGFSSTCIIEKLNK